MSASRGWTALPAFLLGGLAGWLVANLVAAPSLEARRDAPQPAPVSGPATPSGVDLEQPGARGRVSAEGGDEQLEERVAELTAKLASLEEREAERHARLAALAEPLDWLRQLDPRTFGDLTAVPPQCLRGICSGV